jgi:hypothetical protein
VRSRLEELTDELRAEERRVDLDPARVRVDPRQALSEVQRELLEEMAGALGRAERRVKEAIAALTTLERGSPAWHAQRERALALRRDLAIHREALRFPPDPRFYEEHRIPD